MKKTYMIIITILCLILVCIVIYQYTTQKDITDENIIQDNVFNNCITETFSKYQITSETDDFTETIKNNEIDKRYNEEFYEEALTNQEMIDIQKKYVEKWEKEMELSVENLNNILNEDDKIIFRKVQEDWKDSLINMLNFDKRVLLNYDNYSINIGTTFQWLWLSSLREKYRERAIEIKYLNYLLETEKNSYIESDPLVL